MRSTKPRRSGLSLATGAALCLLAATASCSGGARFPEPREYRVWPPPPARPQVQWVGEFPDPDRKPPERPAWRTVLAWVIGETERERTPPPLLARPFGVAAVRGGFIVTDADARKVVRVTWPRAEARELRCAGYRWRMPMAVTTDAAGNVYVADGGAGIVVQISESGACKAIGAGVLERPTGVAVVGDRLFAVDPPLHRVTAFSLAGRRLFSFGGRGDAETEGLNFPTGLCATEAGELLIVDSLNFRISRYSPAGEYLESFGRPGDRGGAFARPKAIAEDSAGRTYVSDAQHDVVLVFAPNAGFEIAVGGSGSGAGELSLPAGLAVDDDFLFVADSMNRRVQIYQLLAEAP